MESIQQFINDHGIVFQVLLYGLLFAYGYNIVTNLFRLFQIWKGIIRLSGFINAYSRHHSVKRKRKLLLGYFPIISRYLGVHSDKLSYGDDDFTLYYRAVPMRDIMLSERDKQKYKLIGSFNPASTLRAVFIFPSKFLIRCGFRPSKAHKSIANIAGIILEVLLAKVIELHYSKLEAFAKSVLDIIWDIWSNIL